MSANINRLNERLLVVLGLSPTTAAIVMERIAELEKENAQLRMSAPAAVPGPLEGEGERLARAQRWIINHCDRREPWTGDHACATCWSAAQRKHEPIIPGFVCAVCEARAAAPASEGKG